MKVKEMAGLRFGRLTVLELAGFDRYGAATWKCRCDCGTVFVTNGAHLRTGDTRSCGCLRNEIAAARIKTSWKSLEIPIAVIRDGKRVECKCIRDAARLVGCAHSTVSKALHRGRTYNGYSFELIERHV